MEGEVIVSLLYIFALYVANILLEIRISPLFRIVSELKTDIQKGLPSASLMRLCPSSFYSSHIYNILWEIRTFLVEIAGDVNYLKSYGH